MIHGLPLFLSLVAAPKHPNLPKKKRTKERGYKN
jgi:hypothetical protein